MITAGTDLRVLLATRAVNFRKQADGLAAIVQVALGADPFCGEIYVFLSKRLDRVKLLRWAGTGICLMTKRLEDRQFRWPPIENGMMKLSKAQLSALLAGAVRGKLEILAPPLKRGREVTLVMAFAIGAQRPVARHADSDLTVNLDSLGASGMASLTPRQGQTLTGG